MEAEASLPHGGWLVSREEASEWALSLEEEAAADHEDKEAHNEDHTTQGSIRHQAVDDKRTQSPPASENEGPPLPLLLLQTQEVRRKHRQE